jgi:hypothetical protein
MIPMIRKTMIMITTAALVFSGTAVSGEIYKWTDEDGNVHYEDRPTGDDVELVAFSSNTDSAAVRASISARRANETARKDARNKRDEDSQTAADEQLIAAERVKRCQDSRTRMETYLTSRRLYKEGEAGERIYLDDSQIMDARSDAQEDIQKYCG